MDENGGVLCDDADNRITYAIELTGNLARATIALRAAGGITSWKAIAIKSGSEHISIIKTAGRETYKETTIPAESLRGKLTLSFAESGLADLWRNVLDLAVTKSGLLGRSITYTWERD